MRLRSRLGLEKVYLRSFSVRSYNNHVRHDGCLRETSKIRDKEVAYDFYSDNSHRIDYKRSWPATYHIQGKLKFFDRIWTISDITEPWSTSDSPDLVTENPIQMNFEFFQNDNWSTTLAVSPTHLCTV